MGAKFTICCCHCYVKHNREEKNAIMRWGKPLKLKFLASFRPVCQPHLVFLSFSLQYAQNHSFQTPWAVIHWVQWQWHRRGEPFWDPTFKKEPKDRPAKPEEDHRSAAHNKHTLWLSHQPRLGQTVGGFHQHERPGWQSHRGERERFIFAYDANSTRRCVTGYKNTQALSVLSTFLK